ncbi:ParB N-terminal domain-containing protein [Leptospira levettii]|uniref:DEAD/DEAH box helicase family protein n=1 Tax=Leptospira levettii TaxID=2023178 RepID=UPI000C2B3D9A|nr:ParB N-terminal domain-containing protein [Leptospira levettii]PJZ89532.1 hypothetical protein CH368_06125 [Leptospira levettii]
MAQPKLSPQGTALKPSLGFFLSILKAKKLPIGHVSVRKDGSKWKKEKDGKWVKVKSGKGQSDTKGEYPKKNKDEHLEKIAKQLLKEDLSNIHFFDHPLVSSLPGKESITLWDLYTRMMQTEFEKQNEPFSYNKGYFEKMAKKLDKTFEERGKELYDYLVTEELEEVPASQKDEKKKQFESLYKRRSRSLAQEIAFSRFLEHLEGLTGIERIEDHMMFRNGFEKHGDWNMRKENIRPSDYVKSYLETPHFKSAMKEAKRQLAEKEKDIANAYETISHIESTARDQIKKVNLGDPDSDNQIALLEGKIEFAKGIRKAMKKGIPRKYSSLPSQELTEYQRSAKRLKEEAQYLFSVGQRQNDSQKKNKGIGMLAAYSQLGGDNLTETDKKEILKKLRDSGTDPEYVFAHPEFPNKTNTPFFRQFHPKITFNDILELANEYHNRQTFKAMKQKPKKKKNVNKSSLFLSILKAKKLPVGHVSVRKDGKYRKQANGEWKKIESSKSSKTPPKPTKSKNSKLKFGSNETKLKESLIRSLQDVLSGLNLLEHIPDKDAQTFDSIMDLMTSAKPSEWGNANILFGLELAHKTKKIHGEEGFGPYVKIYKEKVKKEIADIENIVEERKKDKQNAKSEEETDGRDDGTPNDGSGQGSNETPDGRDDGRPGLLPGRPGGRTGRRGLVTDANSDSSFGLDPETYKKDGILLARSEFTNFPKTNRIPKGIAGTLKEHQKDFVNLALEKFSEGDKGIINMDGTGAGKTRQELALAYSFQIQQSPNKPILIVTKDKGLINDAFNKDADAMGIRINVVKNGSQIVPDGINITTYSALPKLENNFGDFSLVCFDEAHNLKNPGTITTKLGMKLMSQKKVALFTATPVDKPKHFLPICKALGLNADSVLSYCGYQKTKDRKGHETWEPTLDAIVTLERVIKVMDGITKGGLAVKREVPLTNLTTTIKDIDMDWDLYREIRKSLEYYDHIAATNRRRKSEAILGKMRAFERVKVKPVVKMALKDLKEGKQVLIYAGSVNESYIKYYDPLTEKIQEQFLEGTLKMISEALDKEGIPHAKLYGGTSTKAKEKAIKDGIAKFQSGEFKLGIATPQTGGTGYSLDDVHGNAPRKMYILTPPFTATDFVQIVGRINRLTTKTPAEAVMIKSPNSDIDKWNLNIISNKLLLLGGTVKGDFATLSVKDMVMLEGLSPEERKRYLELKQAQAISQSRDVLHSMAIDNSQVFAPELKDFKEGSAKIFRVGFPLSDSKHSQRSFYFHFNEMKSDFVREGKIYNLKLKFGKHKEKYLYEVQTTDLPYYNWLLSQFIPPEKMASQTMEALTEEEAVGHGNHISPQKSSFLDGLFAFFDLILKAKKLPVGHVSVRKDGKYRKQSDGKWMRIESTGKKQVSDNKGEKKKNSKAQDPHIAEIESLLKTLPFSPMGKITDPAFSSIGTSRNDLQEARILLMGRDKAKVSIRNGIRNHIDKVVERYKQIQAKEEAKPKLVLPNPATGKKYSKKEMEEIRKEFWNLLSPQRMDMEGSKYIFREEYNKLTSMKTENTWLNKIHSIPEISSPHSTIFGYTGILERKVNARYVDKQSWNYDKELMQHKKHTKEDVQALYDKTKDAMTNLLGNALSKYNTLYSATTMKDFANDIADNMDVFGYHPPDKILSAIETRFKVQFPSNVLYTPESAIQVADYFHEVAKRFPGNELAEKLEEEADSLKDHFTKDKRTYYHERRYFEAGLVNAIRLGVDPEEILSRLGESSDLQEKLRTEKQKSTQRKSKAPLLIAMNLLFNKKYKSLGAINKVLREKGFGKFESKRQNYGGNNWVFQYVPRYGEDGYSPTFFADGINNSESMDQFRISIVNHIKEVDDYLVNGEESHFYSHADSVYSRKVKTVDEAEKFYKEYTDSFPVLVTDIVKKNKIGKMPLPRENTLQLAKSVGFVNNIQMKKVLVHGKTHDFYANRKVKIDDSKKKELHGEAFSLVSEKARKARSMKKKERPPYKVRPEDSAPQSLITGIKNTLLKHGHKDKAKEFVDLSYIAETVDDIYDIAKDFVAIEGKAKHRETTMEENDLFAKSHLIAIFKGRKAEPIGTKKTHKDGITRVKTNQGWVPVKGSKKPKSTDPKSPKKGKKTPKQDPTPKSEIKPNRDLAPKSLPFHSLKTTEQYTDRKNYDKAQIQQLKESILENGFQEAFPLQIDFRDKAWTVVSGHHRHEAVKQLIEEGKLPDNFQIPVVAREFASENDRLAAQVLENQRRTVLPTDEAKAYKKMQESGWTEDMISKKLGKPVGEIRKRISLTNLSPDLFSLVANKDRSLPVSIGQVIGMHSMNDDGTPNKTIQRKAFQWYQENRTRLGSSAPSNVESYIKELRGQDFGWNAENTASDIQKEAIRTLGGTEKAGRNVKMIESMLGKLQKSYQTILGSSIANLNPALIKELSASLLVQGNIQASKTLGTLDAIINDLNTIKDNLASKMKEIEGDAQTPMMFEMKSQLADIIRLQDLLLSEKLGIVVKKSCSNF